MSGVSSARRAKRSKRATASGVCHSVKSSGRSVASASARTIWPVATLSRSSRSWRSSAHCTLACTVVITAIVSRLRAAKVVLRLSCGIRRMWLMMPRRGKCPPPVIWPGICPRPRAYASDPGRIMGVFALRRRGTVFAIVPGMTARRPRVRMTTGLLLLVLLFGSATVAPAQRATFDEAVVAFEQADYAAAVKMLESLLRRKEEPRVRTLLGWTMYRLGDSARARSEFERALVLGPRDANAGYAHEGLGWIAYR